VLIAVIEASLNSFIGESTPATHALQNLAGAALAIEVVSTGVRIVLLADSGMLRLKLDNDLPAVATVRGTVPELLALLHPDAIAQIRRGSATVSGNLHIAQEFGRLLRLAKPELEEQMARWIGDLPAHQLSSFAKHTNAWARQVVKAIEANVAEYLREESGQVPHAAELEAFYMDIDVLRDDVARASQRIDKLALICGRS